jgi:hypothetical protein
VYITPGYTGSMVAYRSAPLFSNVKILRFERFSPRLHDTTGALAGRPRQKKNIFIREALLRFTGRVHWMCVSFALAVQSLLCKTFIRVRFLFILLLVN